MLAADLNSELEQANVNSEKVSREVKSNECSRINQSLKNSALKKTSVFNNYFKLRLRAIKQTYPMQIASKQAVVQFSFSQMKCMSCT